MFSDPPTIRVPKLDGARRQIETAIWLRFNRGDPVSIHTLCCAGYEIVRVLNRLSGRNLMLKDLWQMLEGESRETFRRVVNSPDNAFKHADRDPFAVAELNTGWTDGLLREAVSGYYALMGGQCSPLMSLYVVWHSIRYRELSQELEAFFDGIDLSAVPESAEAFFSEFAPFQVRNWGRPPA
jgi:hypothetical protein